MSGELSLRSHAHAAGLRIDDRGFGSVAQNIMLLSELGVIRAAHIVLACNTPHRASVLSEQVSINARCVVPAAAAPGDVVEVATQKALDVFRRSAAPFRKRHGRQPSLIVGIDTVVSVGDHALRKPGSVGEAREMCLELAAAGTHKVTTGVALMYGDPGGDAGTADPTHVQTFVEETTVELNAQAMTAPEIEAYVASGEPMDGATPGGYRAHGLGAAFASSVVGDPLNAEHGFPLHRFLAEVDVARLRAWIEATPEERPAHVEDAALDETMAPLPGIECEDEGCGIPSD